MKLALSQLQLGNFTAIDVETTGLYPERGARVIEVGAIRVRNFEIVDNYSSLVNPKIVIPAKIKKINGITNKMLFDAPSFQQIVSVLQSFIGNDLLVAHNAVFDKKFLNAEFRIINKEIKNKFLCTFSLSKQHKIDTGNLKLVNLLNYFNIPLEDTLHRALSDATGAAHLCVNLIKINDSESLLRKSIV
jgi:DNA polymerase III subunit epsilon